MRPLPLIGLIALLLPPGGLSAAHHADLEDWFSRDLLPYVTKELSTSPRFRGESFRFVLLSGDTPRSEGTELAFSLRDRLRDAASDLPGIRVTWLSDGPGQGLASSEGHVDCTKYEADYLIGIELHEPADGVVDVRVAALDVAEREWVPGFGLGFTGPVPARQRAGLNRFISDPTLRGERDAPWADTETDLMAAQLAYELGCKVLGQTAGEYVVAANDVDGNADATTALVELVGNNLAGIRAVRFAAGPTNAVLEGKAHRIDDDLFQYWITITPTDPHAGMRTLSANAYVRIPDAYRAASLVPEASFELSPGSKEIVDAFGIVRMPDQHACPGDRPLYADVSARQRSASDCFALQLSSRADAVTFFLTYQSNHGLVRLADSRCGERAMARVVRAGEKLRVPLPLDTLHDGDWSDRSEWNLNPRADTWFVLAASDARAGRALARHIETLPFRCSASVRPGIRGTALRRWLEALDAIILHWAPSIDWQSIQVRDVY